MNKFDLNAYGVSEMSKQEMVETAGGWNLITIHLNGSFKPWKWTVCVDLIFWEFGDCR